MESVSRRGAKGITELTLLAGQVEIPIRPPTPEPAPTDAPSALPAVLHRPPIRPAPVAGISKSKFELEPNPFEQSFSRSSTSVHRAAVRTQTGSSSEDGKGSGVKGGREGTTEGRQDDETDGGRAEVSRKGSSDDRDTPGEKTALPPLSAMTSPVPVDPASHFSWSGLSSSLRAGPLSPAMLAGPTSASHHAQHGQPGNEASGAGAQNTTHHGGFDPSTFRTGFTPGVGSGFTPNYTGLLTAGGGFPMPSPNTAAFFSMVTNGTPGGATQGNGQQQEHGKVDNGVGGHAGNPSAIPSHLQAPTASATVDITPNTLKALTGVINQMNGSEQTVGSMFPPPPPAAQQSHGPPNGATGHPLPPPPHPEHPMAHATDYFSNGGPHNVHGGPQHHHQQPMSLPPAHLHASADPRVHVPGAYDMHHQQALMNANAQAQAAAAAAAGTGGPLNGLFLLSQAHQELSKREEEQREDANGTAGRPRVGSGGSTRGKRKSEDNGGKSSTGAGGRPAGNKRAKKNGTQDSGPIRNLPAYPGQSILQQSQALLAQGLQAQAERDAMQEEADDDEDQKMLDLAGHAGKDGMDGGDGKTGGKPETEEEKRKNFLERNRQGGSS